MKLFTSAVLIFIYLNTIGQSKSFIPLNYEYPEDILKTPKTYVYYKSGGNTQKFKDIKVTKKPGQIIAELKTYNLESVDDSLLEINDKTVELYIFINGERMNGTVTEDSVHHDSSRLGEKVQSAFFKINSLFVLSLTIRTNFLKDTAIIWKGNPVKCIVVRTNMTEVLSKKDDSTYTKNEDAKLLSYFGQGVGLLRFSVEGHGDFSVWELKEIKDLKQ